MGHPEPRVKNPWVNGYPQVLPMTNPYEYSQVYPWVPASRSEENHKFCTILLQTTLINYYATTLALSLSSFSSSSLGIFSYRHSLVSGSSKTWSLDGPCGPLLAWVSPCLGLPLCFPPLCPHPNLHPVLTGSSAALLLCAILVYP